MTLAPSAQCNIPADWIADFSQCLYEWQGIEAGALALIAALIGVHFLRIQISQNDRLEAERLKRQHNAVRTTLPLTLSGLCESLRQMILALDAAKREVIAQSSVSNFSPPPTPAQYVQELQAVVASTTDSSVVEPIAEIIRELQTLWARIEVLRSGVQQRRRAGLKEDINTWILQAAKVYALVESLFEYARAKSNVGPNEVKWERAESVIFQLGIEDKDLVEAIKKFLERSPNFWSLK